MKIDIFLCPTLPFTLDPITCSLIFSSGEGEKNVLKSWSFRYLKSSLSQQAHLPSIDENPISKPLQKVIINNGIDG
jgi:hypothetical protein